MAALTYTFDWHLRSWVIIFRDTNFATEVLLSHLENY